MGGGLEWPFKRGRSCGFERRTCVHRRTAGAIFLYATFVAICYYIWVSVDASVPQSPRFQSYSGVARFQQSLSNARASPAHVRNDLRDASTSPMFRLRSLCSLLSPASFYNGCVVPLFGHPSLVLPSDTIAIHLKYLRLAADHRTLGGRKVFLLLRVPRSLCPLNKNASSADGSNKLRASLQWVGHNKKGISKK